jgi:hypothetical protein
MYNRTLDTESLPKKKPHPIMKLKINLHQRQLQIREDPEFAHLDMDFVILVYNFI